MLQINLAVGEAATNAILHAYRDRAAEGRRRARRRAPDREELLAVHVQDDGIGLIPRPTARAGARAVPNGTRDRCFEIRGSPVGGTEVVLRFRL